MTNAIASESVVSVSIQKVQGKNNSVLVEFCNTSSKEVYVTHWELGRGGLTKDILKITDQDSQLARYVGKLVKRGSIKEDDLIKVPPQGKISNIVDVEKEYLFQQIKQIEYQSYVPVYELSEGKIEQISFEKLSSNKLSF